MGRLFLHINVSLDGYVNDANGKIDWHIADGEFQRYIDDLLHDIDGMVWGRVAFEEFGELLANRGAGSFAGSGAPHARTAEVCAVTRPSQQ